MDIQQRANRLLRLLLFAPLWACCYRHAAATALVGMVTFLLLFPALP